MFGLIGHLTSLEHAQSVAKELGYPEYADQGLDFWCSAPPQIVDEITVTSVTGQTIEGRYVESCFLPEMLAKRHAKTAIRKILNAMAHAQKHGINITALGGFSSIIFENFKLEQFSQVRNIKLEFERFTTGNTHTAYIICRQVEQASKQIGIDLSKATVAICGATGDIGSAITRWLDARTDVKELLLIARNNERLKDLQDELGRGKIMALDEALPEADIVVWVASMPKGMEIDFQVLKRPCLLIDGGYPKNLATKIQYPGIHVLNGGIVEHSLDIDWKIMKIVNMDVPARQLFACFAESMLLEFEKLYTNFSWGRNQITVDKMEQIGQASIKHGFRPLLVESLVVN
ncbi:MULTISPECIES: long-chain acyl-[acyl-carrier-protein] reductase [unclassified Nodularia (in: cyanobacteria)]|uniref:long-chain acyl-[acyl-carrier-protein] reductase n=1 Tax=unclassified Nodularia (in: cyanobacteria) TaxID=2656917 RepID=UPI001882F73C|nr:MULTISPECIES: long-chain acyl-[acyl-carrier-protein] reductase [unclassified Nodularia (in: cyanobacteria)]MBE9201255.1 long-chain acyl-[acyl-carrier-protein] reductase [Nodularia sp. LEGE 06071]MCC2695814.1 long-chain acyl-[acyl-carrier-protein] reductase [Nodularia sp. LEGE 04288]